MDQGLLHTLIVSFGYHYALNLVLSRLAPRRARGVAPAIRQEHAALSRRRRRQWRTGLAAVVLGGLIVARRRR
jgi:hypothetical protein